mgnify:CR=1 FL=1
MILIKNLYKKFDENLVLNGIDLTIPQGNVFGILGPNGSGKTTLLKTILGMVIPNQGIIEVFGQNISKVSNYRHSIGYLSQSANFPPNLKVHELFTLIKNIRNKKSDYKEFLGRFNLDAYLNKKINSLSGGTRQKINIALAFMFNSPIIILDEPTAGLDPISLIRLKEMIQTEREKGKTILITSHIMSFIEEISDQIIFLFEGKIYFKGKISEIKLKAKPIENGFPNCLTDFEQAITSILKDKNV